MIISPLVYILAPIFCGIVIYLLKLNWMRYIVLPLQLFLLVASVITFFQVGNQNLVLALSSYPRPIGMSLSLDTFALLMLILTNILFLAFNFFDLDEEYNRPLFIFLFISLQGLCNGIFLSNDIFNIYIMVELATIVVSVLIMYKKDPDAMYNGMFYLMICIFAMSFYLFGVGFLYKYFGVLDFTSLKELIPAVSDKKVLILPFSFIFTALSLKVLIMPIFPWLAKAHSTPSAPSVVTAILSGIFVKIGLYLMLRMFEILGNSFDLESFFIVASLITAIVSLLLAIAQNDIKMILCYHTVSQLALVVFAYTASTIKIGAMYHCFTHGIFKSLLFLIASEMINIYSTRDIRKMRGLFRHSKTLSICLLIGIVSITGFPFFSGGLSQSLMLYGMENSLYRLFYYLLHFGTMVSFYKFFITLFGDKGVVYKREFKFSEWSAFFILCFFAIYFGIPNNPFLLQLGNVGSYVGEVFYFKESLIYLAMMFLSYFVYRFIKDWKGLLSLNKLDIPFNNAALTIVLYFVAMINYLLIVS